MSAHGLSNNLMKLSLPNIFNKPLVHGAYKYDRKNISLAKSTHLQIKPLYVTTGSSVGICFLQQESIIKLIQSKWHDINSRKRPPTLV